MQDIKPKSVMAVMFMVDMSGSTLGWVNDAESHLYYCEALTLLGDKICNLRFRKELIKNVRSIG